MQAKFDVFNRFEVPNFYVCNPGSVYDNGLLTKVLGCLSHTTGEELTVNFNTTSELNFKAYKVESPNSEENLYLRKLYQSLKNRRLIFVDGVGYFVITSIVDGYHDQMHYKDVTAKSCEIEIQNKSLVYIEDGTYLFTDLLQRIVSTLPLWKIGTIDGDVAKKYRTFEGVSADLNTLAFMLENMQDAYECIFVFDTIHRLIHVYDQNSFVEQGTIHITKDDLVNSIEIKEQSDDLYTAISVFGSDDLNISPVNPLGANLIYNFDYYLDWMSPDLKNKVIAWQNLIKSKSDEYYALNLSYYNDLTTQSDLQSEIDRVNMQIEMYERCRDNIVAEGTTATVQSYNEIIEKNGGVPVGIQNELAATIAEIDRLTSEAKSTLSDVKTKLDSIATEISATHNSIVSIHESVAISSYFTQDEYDELSNYIYEGTYRDEYITVTNIMTYAEKFQQMKTLYDRAIAQLERISSPTQKFSIDVENFIFIKQFSAWSEQLEVGCLINVELENDDVALLFLSNITVNYDDKTLSLTFGNRLNRYDHKSLYSDVLGNVKKSTNSINYIKEILYPVKNGEFDVMREAIESSGVLTKDAVMASTNQEILIDDTGILGRKLLDNGEYDPKQIKLTNQTIVFTDDGWETARTALGNFYFNNPLTGEVEEHYGIIADTLIGSLILSEEVGIYNTDSSITLDKTGFTLTSDYTSDESSRVVFTIQKKLLDDSGREYYQKQLYVDDNGNVVLNGTVSVYTQSGETSLDGISSSIKELDENVGEELTVLQTQINTKTDDLSNTIENNTSDLYNAIKAESDEINANIDSKIANVNNSVTERINSVSSEIDNKYAAIINDVNAQLEAHKADVGQYMLFNDDGLTLGATTSEFKTVIDNTGLYFKQGNTIVSYVNNNQLHIPNAVIESTLILGNFFFNPREDGGVSLTWQE